MGKRMVAVAVGVLVAVALGVGGVLVASRNGQGTTPARLPALDVSGAGGQAGTSAQASPGRSGPVDGRSEPSVPPSGRVQYQVRGTLPDLPRSARAWTLPDQVTKDRVAELAARLGLSGQPTRSGQAWAVADGARRLFVNAVAGGPWTFTSGRLVCGGPVGGLRPKPGIVHCPVAPAAEPSAAPRPTPVQPLQPLQVPDRESAQRIAGDLFARVGAPVSGGDLRLTQSFDRWSASLLPKIGGVPTMGFIWTAGIGPKGEIVSATGWLDTPRQGDEYPLISVQEALQRLRNRQVAGPIPDDGASSALCARTDQPQGPAGACGRQPLNLQVTGARLGLQLATTLAETAGARRPLGFLVPAYCFQIDGSWDRQVSVIAVQDRFLSTTPTPTAVPLRPGG